MARLGQMVVVILVTLLVTFSLVHVIPGDPAVTILGQRASPQAIAALRSSMHLDQPILTQLWIYVRHAAVGNLGTSLEGSGVSVTSLIGPALGVTGAVVGVTALISLALGMAAGIAAGTAESKRVDGAIKLMMMIALGTPPFVAGFFLLLLALHTGIAPVGGWGSSVGDDLKYVWLPALALSAYLTPVIARTVRQSARDVIGADFIEAAIARGTPTSQLVLHHVLPNSALPVITLMGYNVGALLSGAVIIEIVFNLPGIGSLLFSAISNRDYPLVQGIAIVAAVSVVVCNGLADILYQLVDPRTRSAR